MQESDLHPYAHRPWGLYIVLIVIVLFGAYWYVERADTVPVLPTPQPVTTRSPAAIDITTLQASVIDSEIPDFSKDF